MAFSCSCVLGSYCICSCVWLAWFWCFAVLVRFMEPQRYVFHTFVHMLIRRPDAVLKSHFFCLGADIACKIKTLPWTEKIRAHRYDSATGCSLGTLSRVSVSFVMCQAIGSEEITKLWLCVLRRAVCSLHLHWDTPASCFRLVHAVWSDTLKYWYRNTHLSHYEKMMKHKKPNLTEVHSNGSSGFCSFHVLLYLARVYSVFIAHCTLQNNKNFKSGYLT